MLCDIQFDILLRKWIFSSTKWITFLQDDLDDEEIYMEQPERFRDDGAPEKACRLKNALYGLKKGKQRLEHQAGP